MCSLSPFVLSRVIPVKTFGRQVVKQDNVMLVGLKRVFFFIHYCSGQLVSVPLANS